MSFQVAPLSSLFPRRKSRYTHTTWLFLHPHLFLGPLSHLSQHMCSLHLSARICGLPTGTGHFWTLFTDTKAIVNAHGLTSFPQLSQLKTVGAGVNGWRKKGTAWIPIVNHSARKGKGLMRKHWTLWPQVSAPLTPELLWPSLLFFSSLEGSRPH